MKASKSKARRKKRGSIRRHNSHYLVQNSRVMGHPLFKLETVEKSKKCRKEIVEILLRKITSSIIPLISIREVLESMTKEFPNKKFRIWTIMSEFISLTSPNGKLYSKFIAYQEIRNGNMQLLKITLPLANNNVDLIAQIDSISTPLSREAKWFDDMSTLNFKLPEFEQ